MFRSPISPASFLTSARNSSRRTTSAGESSAVFEIFFPGIFIPNSQSIEIIAAIASAIRKQLRKKSRNIGKKGYNTGQRSHTKSTKVRVGWHLSQPLPEEENLQISAKSADQLSGHSYPLGHFRRWRVNATMTPTVEKVED